MYFLKRVGKILCQTCLIVRLCALARKLHIRGISICSMFKHIQHQTYISCYPLIKMTHKDQTDYQNILRGGSYRESTTCHLSCYRCKKDYITDASLQAKAKQLLYGNQPHPPHTAHQLSLNTHDGCSFWYVCVLSKASNSLHHDQGGPIRQRRVTVLRSPCEMTQ